jgi:hypothetical protein
MTDIKVLITAPQHISKMYCWPQYSDRLKELTYNNMEFFFSDNSPTKENSERITNDGFKCEHLDLKGMDNVFTRITESHKQCRKYFLDNDFDYMLHLETDVIPPADIIERLLQKRKMVVSGIYDIGTGFDRKLMIQPLAKMEHRNVKAWKSVDYLNELESIEVDGTTKKVFSCGLGCILISKEIVNMIDFRNDESVLASADTFWANDLYANGVPIYAATDIYCDHLSESWHTNLGKLKLNYNTKNK